MSRIHFRPQLGLAVVSAVAIVAIALMANQTGSRTVLAHQASGSSNGTPSRPLPFVASAPMNIDSLIDPGYQQVYDDGNATFYCLPELADARDLRVCV